MVSKLDYFGMDGKLPQEETSTYFNTIINADRKPMTIDELDEESISKFEQAVAEAFPDDCEVVNKRIRYLIPYILQSIDWDLYSTPLHGWQLQYYYKRERFLEVTALSYEDFCDHDLLIRSLEDLGLEPEPTFEFILFLRYYFTLRSELRHSPFEQFQQLRQALGGDLNKASMTVAVNGKNFKFENKEFIRQLFYSVDETQLDKFAFKDDFCEGSARDKVRALDYYMIKTLLDYLPTQVGNRRGRYTQAERNFSLCVLNFCGRLNGDDIEGICSHENNVTFDKLMRDFKDTPIPFAMELFL